MADNLPVESIVIEIEGKDKNFTSTVDKAIAKTKELNRASKSTSAKGGNNSSKGLKETSRAADEAKAKLDILRSSINMVKSAGAKSFSVVGKGLASIGKAGAMVAGSPLLGVKKAFEGIRERAGNLFKMFKKRVMYRLMNGIISGITNGIKTGINNAYAYAVAKGNQLAKSLDSIATSALYVKNSLGAMAAPIINAVAPAIDWLADKFVDLLNIINQVIARLTGASTWLKAIKYPATYGEEAKNATKANKELKKSILGLDEINPLTDNSNGKGGAGASGMDATKMFEEMPVGEIGKQLGDIFKPFKDAWDKEGKNTLTSIKNAFTGVKSLIGGIGTSLKTVWENGTGAETIGNILGIFQGIMNTIGNISSGIATAWNYAGTGTRIVQNVANAFNSVLGFVKKVWTYTAMWAKKLNFKPLMSSIERLTATFKPLIDVVGGALLEAYNMVLLPLAGWAIEDGAPKSIDAVSSAIKFLTSVLKVVKSTLKTVWAAAQPVITWLGGVASNVLDSVKRLFEKLSNTIDERGGKIKDTLSNIGETFKVLWVVIEPILTFIGKYLTAAFDTAADVIATALGYIIDNVSGVIKILKGMATGDWKTVWQGFREVFEAQIKLCLGIAESFVNGWIRALNTIIDSINKIGGLNLKKLAEVNWTGKTATSKKPQVNKKNKQMQTFASGGTPEMGTMFFAGEAGAEVVANVGNRTGVMNVQQLSAGVEQGVMFANEALVRETRESNTLLRAILNKNYGAGNTSGVDFISAAQQKNRRDGRTIIPVGV